MLKKVPEGKYEVKIEKLELVESKKGDPMVSCWFKILGGKYKGNRIFMNQVVTQGFQIHIVNEFLRSLDTEIAIDFSGYHQYSNMLMDAAEEASQFVYVLDYGKNKGFPTFKITDVFTE